MSDDHQMHTQEQERDHRNDVPQAIIDQQDHRGYSVETLREVCDHLSWHVFSEGELNQINRIAIILQAQVRSRYAARRAEEKEKRRLDMIANPERFTPLQREQQEKWDIETRGGRYPANPITGKHQPYVGD